MNLTNKQQIKAMRKLMQARYQLSADDSRHIFPASVLTDQSKLTYFGPQAKALNEVWLGAPHDIYNALRRPTVVYVELPDGEMVEFRPVDKNGRLIKTKPSKLRF